VAPNSTQPVPIERRSSIRFPIQFRIRYQTVGRGRLISGVGQTVNISSGGLLVTSENDLSARSRLEVSIEWPPLLDGSVRLQMVIIGRVVRSEGSTFAVAFVRHELRTKRCSVQPLAPFRNSHRS
jgi:hypothetical protein